MSATTGQLSFAEMLEQLHSALVGGYVIGGSGIEKEIA